MAYSDFTLGEVLTRFQLSLQEQLDLFAAVPPLTPSGVLQTVLNENIPLALAIHTEKARSELIIAPMLVEVRRLTNRQISLFSGVDFTVDPAQGLNGVCDFIVSLSAEQLLIRAPVLTLSEAKNENIKGGYAQCIAAMIAAQLFNARAGNNISAVYGVVTTGSIWRFLKVSGAEVVIDLPEYYLDQVGKILAILLNAVQTSQLISASS